MNVNINDCIPLTKMYAVYTKIDDGKWTIFSSEPDSESAKITASMLEVTNPNTSVKIIEPKLK